MSHRKSDSRIPRPRKSAKVVLGRGLISTEPDADGCEFDEGEVVRCKLVIAGGDAPTLLDLVEEPLDQITRSIQIRAEADRLFAIALRRDIGPCALLAGERPDPVCVISSICQQHRSWMQSGQENRT